MPMLTLFPFLGVDTSQPLSCLCSWDKCSSLFAAWTCKPGGVMMGSLVCLQKHVPHCLSFYPALEKDGVPIRCLPDSLDYGSCHTTKLMEQIMKNLNKWASICQRHVFVSRDGWIHKLLLAQRRGSTTWKCMKILQKYVFRSKEQLVLLLLF